MISIKKITSTALAALMIASTLTALPASATESTVNEASAVVSTASAKSYLTDDIIASSGYSTSYTSRYAYKKLSASEKKLYKNIVIAARNLDQNVTVPSGLSEETVKKVYTIVYHNEPQLFWIKAKYPYYAQGVNTLYMDYHTDDIDEIEDMQDEINKTVKSLIKKAKKKSTTYAKLKIFYDYLVLNNDFQLDVDKNGINATIYGAFTDYESLQCAGYAKAMQYLCDLAGIKSMVVTGTNKSGTSHAWNIVYCGDGYYHLDATWGDPINDYNEDYIQYEFFLVPTSWIKNYTHYNINKYDLDGDGDLVTLYSIPSCTKTKYNYFVKSGKNYSTASKAYTALQSQIKSAVKDKTTVVEVRVTSSSVYKTLVGKSYKSKILKYAKSCSSKVKSVSVVTAYNGKSYVVHYNINYKT